MGAYEDDDDDDDNDNIARLAGVSDGVCVARVGTIDQSRWRRWSLNSDR